MRLELHPLADADISLIIDHYEEAIGFSVRGADVSVKPGALAPGFKTRMISEPAKRAIALTLSGWSMSFAAKVGEADE